MLNKKLLQAVPEAMPYIRRTVLFEWLSMLCGITAYGVLALVSSQLVLERSFTGLGFRLCILAAALFGRWFFTLRAVQASAGASESAKRTIRKRLLAKLASLSWDESSAWNTSELVQLAGEGTEQLESYFASYIPQFFYALLAPLTLFVITLFLNVPAAFALLLCVPLIPVSIVAVQKFAKKLLAKYWGQYTTLGDSFLENLQGLTTLKIYQADQARHEKMNEEAENFRKITMRVLIMQLNSISVMDLVAYGGAALGMLLGILAWRTHTMSLFRVLFLILIASEFFLPMRALGSFFHIAMNGQAAAEKLFTILETVSRVPGTGIPDSLDIEARNLGWEYEPGHPVLQDVSLHIKPGASIGIAGQSGSGKSTLAALIRGRLSDSGVTIGGVPVPDIDPAWLQENLTVLDHHGFLFEGTIRDNLCLADPEAEDEQLMRAMKQAGINLPLDAPVRENGSNLSGGQRQRIALARALVKDAPVLILDEATSAVDAQSENAIMQAVKGLKDKTLIIISHRLVNLQDTQEILVLDHGRPAGCASHDSLLKESPAYASLWNAQQELERYGKESA